MGRPTEAAAAGPLTGLLLDEMCPPALAHQLRAAGHDVVAVLEVEVGLASKSDEDVLAWAARNNRCVMTENVSDFMRLAQQGSGHAGILFISSRRYPRTASSLPGLGKAVDELLSSRELPGRDGVAWLR